jgi:hypothetical protein
MRTPWMSFLIAAIVATTASRTARGADERLLVVVESGPGVGVDARDVRQTIGAELGIAVVAPSDAAAVGASNVLIVAVDKTDIRMSLRGSAAGLVARTIPSPVDRPARLREIGWLAGNLARDQVSGIVAVPAERAVATKALVIAAADLAPAAEPSPAVAPPPLPPPAAQGWGMEPAESVSARPVEAQASRGSPWAITAAGGPTATFNTGNGPAVLRDTSYQLEAQHQASPNGLILGVALEVGTDAPVYGSQLGGIAGLVGSGWHRRHWFLEATTGVGLELARLSQTTRTVTNSSLTGSSSSSTESSDIQPILYLRGVGTVGVPISTSLDLVARLGVHVASSGGFATDFLSATAGLRFTIP